MRAYERLLKYVAFDTTSDEDSPSCPSTPNQLLLAQALADELRGLGVADARVDAYGYVYGSLPATAADSGPALGVIAHMDTSASAPGANIRARIAPCYDGGELVLNKALNIVLSPERYPVLKDYIGQDLVVTDGSTLLGADDKAGIAEIMTAVERIQREALPHGKLCFAFTPDEEIGRGVDHFDVAGFGAQFAYTADGGRLGEIEYENFNAASAVATIRGVSIHPGDAKGKLKNAILIAMEFNAMLPCNEIPAATEGYEGFYHLRWIEGDEEKTILKYIVRDHDEGRFTEKKERLKKIAAYLNDRYGAGTVELELTDSYYNMKSKVEPYPFLIENARKALEAEGVAPAVVPIRGGTDGAMLSFMGLPCPNLCTGGHNYHGRFEFIPVQSMDVMVSVLVRLMEQNSSARDFSS